MGDSLTTRGGVPPDGTVLEPTLVRMFSGRGSLGTQRRRIPRAGLLLGREEAVFDDAFEDMRIDIRMSSNASSKTASSRPSRRPARGMRRRCVPRLPRPENIRTRVGSSTVPSGGTPPRVVSESPIFFGSPRPDLADLSSGRRWRACAYVYALGAAIANQTFAGTLANEPY